MKRIIALFVMVTMLCSVPAALCEILDNGTFAAVSEVMLMSVYRQQGWGDRLQIGVIDADGGVWYAEFDEGLSDFPSDGEGRVEYVKSHAILGRYAELDSYDTERIKSILWSIEPEEVNIQPAACDAGTQTSYAVSYGGDGARPVITLGVSRDDLYENTDTNAQELYLILRQTFPQLISYYGTEGMSPTGFKPVPITEFLNIDDIDASSLSMKTYLTDCEEGLFDAENDTTPEEILSLYVVGKENCMTVTGGTYDLVFSDTDGEYVFSISLYHGLLVTNDGMYRLDAPK